MSVNLKKGQKVDLRKPDGGTLHRVMVGLGWDEVEQPKKWFAPKPQPIDCDATAFLCEDDKVKATMNSCLSTLTRCLRTWKKLRSR